MTTYGYAYALADKEYLDAQLTSLKAYGVDEIVLEKEVEEAGKNHQGLEILVEKLCSDDRLVVLHLVSIGKSIIQLADLLHELENKGAQLVVIEKSEELVDLSDKELAAIIRRFAMMEKIIIRERTSRGLEVARRKGRIGGRPKISQETVERIQFLYNNNKYTLRQIAEECNISLGTAYKYTQDQK
ncbi:recombinase family protein [Vagococcus elongatus]|uniref:Resolvase/invertase-type recombinase catalytic domain-containing protein n=1 Tax=Vagococcus elongatus TaxID=180344 RepID=A0A430ALB4_9ENTE|nr:recombinase family protein [Vagococcus elongatus]RSU08898.1 hypothetical protein CBF29_12975 [Vagococcus elongatus]